jgi:hypothetical protein
VGEKLVRFGRCNELTFHAVKQQVAELLLGVRQNLGDRRLRHAEQRSGTSHRATGVYRVKHFDLP